jgi:hypothetical protein
MIGNDIHFRVHFVHHCAIERHPEIGRRTIMAKKAKRSKTKKAKKTKRAAPAGKKRGMKTSAKRGAKKTAKKAAKKSAKTAAAKRKPAAKARSASKPRPAAPPPPSMGSEMAATPGSSGLTSLFRLPESGNGGDQSQ